jgi:hypothetical protein
VPKTIFLKFLKEFVATLRGEKVEVKDKDGKICAEEDAEQVQYRWNLDYHISFYYFASVLSDTNFVDDDILEVGFISGRHTSAIK